MGLVVKVKLKDGEKIKNYLIENGLLDMSYSVLREDGFLFFPVLKEIKKYKCVEKKLKRKKKEKSVKDMLKGKLSSAELKMLPRTFEEVGDILVLEINDELKGKKKLIGEAFLKRYNQVKTVLMKKDEHSGEFRLRKLEWLAGVKKKETEYKENGVWLKVNLEKVYFSSKSANERLRIAKLVKKGEEVLVMFSGLAPFPLVIARNSLVKEVIGVELNPYGHKLGEENVKLNKLNGKVKLIQGDVRKVVPKLKGKFDRVVMPLPKTGEEFLDVVLDVVKDGGIVHLYGFLGEENFNSDKKRVLKLCKDLGKKCKVVRFLKCGNFAPGVFRVVYDLKIGV